MSPGAVRMLSRASRGSASRGFARCTRDADRRSAFQAVPALLPGRLPAVSPASGGRCRSEERRSQPSAPYGIGRGCGTHIGRAQRHRHWFRAPARCRPEVGVPSRPRAFSPSAMRGFSGPAGRGAALKSGVPGLRATRLGGAPWLALAGFREVVVRVVLEEEGHRRGREALFGAGGAHGFADVG